HRKEQQQQRRTSQSAKTMSSFSKYRLIVIHIPMHMHIYHYASTSASYQHTPHDTLHLQCNRFKVCSLTGCIVRVFSCAVSRRVVVVWCDVVSTTHTSVAMDNNKISISFSASYLSHTMSCHNNNNNINNPNPTGAFSFSFSFS